MWAYHVKRAVQHFIHNTTFRESWLPVNCIHKTILGGQTCSFTAARHALEAHLISLITSLTGQTSDWRVFQSTSQSSSSHLHLNVLHFYPKWLTNKEHHQLFIIRANDICGVHLSPHFISSLPKNIFPLVISLQHFISDHHISVLVITSVILLHLISSLIISSHLISPMVVTVKSECVTVI